MFKTERYMELFLELTRNCNMACGHCLRGEAQNKYMPDHIIAAALGLSDGYVGIGGGEPLATSKLMQRLWNVVQQSGEVIGTLFLVTNGLGVLKSPKILETLSKITPYDIYLNVSTDQWHDDGAMSRFYHVEDEADMRTTNVRVGKQGPSEYSQLIKMGRHWADGKDLKLDYESVANTMYVDVHGNVWATCDLSYDFMDEFKESMLYYGNVLTDTEEQIQYKQGQLVELLEEGGDLSVTESWIAEELELKQLV